MTSVYKVEFVETLRGRVFNTFVHIRARTEQEAERKVKRGQRHLAQGAPFEINILSTTKIGSREEQILDRLFDLYPRTYYKLWEPDISTKNLIEDLKREYPHIYETLGGQNA